MRREKRKINSLLTPVRIYAEQDGSGVLIVSLPTSRKRKRRFCNQGVDQCGQATKGVWGMPWRQEAMKGVEDCDKLGGLVKRELIPRSLNHPGVNP